MASLSVSKESVLKHLADIGQGSRAGRPRSEDKIKEETKKSVKLGDSDEEEGYTVPVDELFLPGEMADFQQQLKDSKPEDLRVRLAKQTFENRGLKRWITNAIKQLSKAEKGEKVMLPPLPAGLPNELGVEDSSAGVTKMLKEIMPSITQYKLVRDIMKDEEGGGESKDKGMIEYESPDGMKIKMPAGSFMPGMFNPFMMQGNNAAGPKGEPMVKVKVGDNEFEAPQSQIGLMYALMNQPKAGEREATVKIKDEEGEEREVPASAVGAILDLQKMVGGAKKESESNITITDENGKEITMPASFYPQYLMQQQLNKQLQQLSSGSRGRGEGPSRNVPDQAMASMYGMMSEMKDTMRQVGQMMNPEKLGEMAVKGLMDKVEEWEQLKSFFGGGSGEESEVKKERLKQQGEIQRLKIQEEEKTKREKERTAQAAAEARKFELLMQPQVGGEQKPEEEEKPEVLLDEAYKKAKAINEEFIQDLQQGEEEEKEIGGALEEEGIEE